MICVTRNYDSLKTMALNSNKVQLQVTEVSGIAVCCVCPLISGTYLELLKGQDNLCVIMIQHFVI